MRKVAKQPIIWWLTKSAAKEHKMPKKTAKKKRVSSRDAQQQRVRELVKTNSTLELFLRALTQLYPMDKLAPGLVLSALPATTDGDVDYYAAVVRYELEGVASPANPGHKQTLVNVIAPTMQMALITLMEQWQGKTRDAAAFADTTVRVHGKKVRRG